MTEAPAPSRRNLLFGGAAALGGVVAGAGLAWIGLSSPNDFLIDIVQRALPGVTIDRKAAQKFASEFFLERNNTFGGDKAREMTAYVKWKGSAAINGVMGTEAIAKVGPFENTIEEILPTALTMFLVNSNFFHLEDPTSEPIVYTYRPPGTPCINPFADLSPPAPRGRFKPTMVRHG